jgi:SAM-dependent methyltransferase
MEKSMKQSKVTNTVSNEMEFIEQLLSLDGKKILDLGCGKAQITRLIATNGDNRKIIATEVDEIQHNKNLLIDDLPNVTFLKAGSEKIPLDDDSIDMLFMFKSLHHVPVELMGIALDEIKRVLKPEGVVYISEPIFEGEFNDVLRLFHDEEKVRKAAYSSITKSIKNKDLFLIDEILFNTPMYFANFEEFENNVINVTHTNHKLSPKLHQKVKDQFSLTMKDDGAKFLMPIRVNLLQKKV